ncbi:unnamed protein product [Schistosoma mattheei]|uniref:Uncharacterized protein n=1 Tax=Schistosoma mattheei TaxID=31246 RepID=A0A183NP51_9TREM|nr:unnamed protein product [Schistosoma mattheei]
MVWSWSFRRSSELLLPEVRADDVIQRIIDEHGGPDADVKARIGKTRAEYLQLKNIWNSKQLNVNQHQSQNFQCNCQDCSIVWGGNLENYESFHPEDTSVYFQLHCSFGSPNTRKQFFEDTRN